MKKDIKSMKLDQIEQLIKQELAINQPFRAVQIFEWLHKRCVSSFDDMSNLSKEVRNKLIETCYIDSLEIEKKMVSKLDGTVKYLFKMADNECIESVAMQHNHGLSLCISSQVGCRMGCKFCASTIGGLKRNLTAAQMLLQIEKTEQDLGKKINSIVIMGIGEPLDNFENLLAFLENLSSKHGRNMSLRNVCVSTSGIVPKIAELMNYKLPITLSVSLHATTDAKRSALMPVNNSWNIDKLINQCKLYTQKTGRRLSIEYSLIDGVNDLDSDADRLAEICKQIPLCHVNLIPVNPIKEQNFKGSKNSYKFRDKLINRNVNATIRRKLGADIDAACGQLRNNSSI